jgi:hypothetical protein
MERMITSISCIQVRGGGHLDENLDAVRGVGVDGWGLGSIGGVEL